MIRRMGLIGLTLATVWIGLGSLVADAQASDWKRWLGPNQDGTFPGDGLFPSESFGLDVVWSRPLGVAYSGIAVAEGRAVTLFADGEFDWLTAVDVKSGEELWRYKIDAMYAAHDGSEGGASSMPVVDEGVVYGLGAKGHLFAVRLATGKEVWSLRIDEKLGARAPSYGFATTPLVAGELLFVQSGGTDGRSLAAFDKGTGDLRWSTGDDPVGYQSPVLATLAGREQILAATNSRILGLDPRSGEVLWSLPSGVEENEDGYATAVLLGDDRFLMTGQQASTTYRVRAVPDGYEVDEIWSTRDLKQSLASPVPYDGHLYGFSGEFLTCVDVSTGEKVWRSRPPGGRGLILVDGHLVIFANDGAVVVVEASAEGYREKARLKVSEAGTYTYPSYADGRFFVRNTRDFAAVKVGAAPPPAESAAAELAAPAHAFERFVRKVEQSDHKRLLVNDFMASQPRFPVVEDDRWVHFIYRGDVDDVAILGSMLEFRVEEPMQHLEGTDLFHRSYPIEPGARWEYRFNVDFDNQQPDPLNPLRVAGDEGDLSEVRTAGWKPPEFLRPYEGGRPGQLESFTHASEILGNERAVDVYLPAGYGEGDWRYPLLVVNDGKDWLEKAHLANTLDHLVNRSVAPIIAAFVEMPQTAARQEFGGEKAADHVRMLTEELIPRLDADYRTLAKPDARALIGAGGGALMAVYASALRPDVFGLSGAFSVYLPNPEAPQLMEALSAGTFDDTKRAWVVWNRYELARAEWNVDLARDSRRVAEALGSHGLVVESREALDSAGWGSWRVHVGEILALMFPR